jgi:hypothetical protein
MTDSLYKARQEHAALVQRLRDAFPDESDADLFDSIMGETSLDEAIIRTLRAANENDATAAGLKAYMEKLAERAEILKVRSERLRQSALQAAQESGIALPLKAPDFTASIAKGKPKVVIADPDAVPDTFCRITKTPNKSAIADALAAGLKPPWASYSNAIPYWTVRIR